MSSSLVYLAILSLFCLIPVSSLEELNLNIRGDSLRCISRARIVEDEKVLFRRNFDVDSDEDERVGEKSCWTSSITADLSVPVKGLGVGIADPSKGSFLRDKLRQKIGALDLAISLPDSSSTYFPSPRSSHFNEIPKSRLRSTGTTIAGVCIKDYVVLGADTRATDRNIVADKRCEKIHYLAPLVYACGAGTAGDLDMTTRAFRYQLQLERSREANIGNDGPSSEVTSGFAYLCKLFKSRLYDCQGQLGVNLVMGGVENGRPHLVAIHPHGSMDVVPYVALGSGSLAAMAVLEARYHQDMTLEEAKKIVSDSIQAGIRNDLGSGSQVDLCIICTDGSCDYLRAFVCEQELDFTQASKNGKAKAEQGYSRSGVNGFGNLSYEVESTAMLLPAFDTTKATNLEKLIKGFRGHN